MIRMNIYLNGKKTDVAEQATVLLLLESMGLADKRVAIEVNGQIVPRSLHSQHRLQDSDQVEIVVAVGGG
jgi:sulfur carrier protein